jgi:hypothetical protein
MKEEAKLGKPRVKLIKSIKKQKKSKKFNNSVRNIIHLDRRPPKF